MNAPTTDLTYFPFHPYVAEGKRRLGGFFPIGTSPALVPPFRTLRAVDRRTGGLSGYGFHCGFLTAIQILENYVVGISGFGEAEKDELVAYFARFRGDNGAYRFFEDSGLYPEDVDTTALITVAEEICGILSASERNERIELIERQREGDSYLVWFKRGNSRRNANTEAMVDANVQNALEFLKARELGKPTSVQLISTPIESTRYYKDAAFRDYLGALWSSLIRPEQAVRAARLDELKGREIVTHGHERVGYVLT